MRSQTATEYLIVLAVVLVIGLLVVTVLGGIPGIGSGDQEDISELALQTELIGVNNYVSSSTNTTFWIQNNENERVTVEGLWVDQKACATEYDTFPKQLKIGEEIEVVCYNIQSLSETPRVNIRYEDRSSVEIVTADNQNYKGTTTNNCYGQQTVSGVYDICTCDDLNLTRLNLTYNYALRYNIDFLEPHCTQYREGNGWWPIGNQSASEPYLGYFNGYGYIVENLYIARSGVSGVGLFGRLFEDSSNYGNISNLGLTNVDVTGNTFVGGLVGFSQNSRLNNVFVEGSVTGSLVVGGVAGAIRGGGGGILNNSFALVSLTSTSLYNGGLVGTFEGSLENSFSEGIVSGGGASGGLVGNDDFGDISFRNVYTTTTILDCSSDCGGVLGGGPLNEYINVTWTNFSDSAVSCLGSTTANPENCTAINP